MLKLESQPWMIVWYDGEGSLPLDGDIRFKTFRSLLERGYNVVRAALGQGGGMISGVRGTNRMLVLGSFPDGAPRLEDAAGEVEIAVRDITALDADGILDTVEAWRGGGAMNQPPQAGGTSWKPWFPVIDYSRCTNCMQCLSFCLFDVYGIDEKQKIQVQNQDNCKTNCPACSRVCPEVAIMFPKYSGGPINGAPVSEQDVNREKMKVDISALLGGDIYASLRTRSEAAKSRFSKERSPDKALEERKKCLVKLQSDGFIPAEVLASIDLASLPSPDEIMRKAQEKAAQAAAARGEV
ncbi:MAG: NAD-dependent dihydropyrimidine dehydrogenase, PreA subunit [Verrucomicrobia bacterium]|jgi:NAD-dependent dihydropyrimidine dehydrogenase PreA subunit|nr:MAG: NAD-dependent dihydropyrimidine dehydrogenase, PreA subunit [Verrucomicrobiota bacterium]